MNTSNEKGVEASQLHCKKKASLTKAIIVGAVLFVIEAALWYADVSSLYIFLIELAELIATLAFAIIAVRYLAQKSYPSALAVFLVTILMAFAFPVPSGLFTWSKSQDAMHLLYANEAAYLIKYSLNEEKYLREVSLIQPDKDGLRYKEFNWGRGAADWTALVYDESDAFGLPENRSEAWWARVGGKDGILSCPHEVYKIKSHFFVVSATCLNY